MNNGYNAITVEKNFFVDSIPAKNRGRAISVADRYDAKMVDVVIENKKVHDDNFAFLSTELAKLHTKLYEPKWNVYYLRDIDIDYGGGFVDYVEYFTVDWAGIMDANRNIFGNNANYIPRVNAALTQKKVNVYTYEVAYDLRFVELEKMKKLTLQKSIQDIYKDAIVAGFDLFVQEIAYNGIHGEKGLFNNDSVKIFTIDNATASGKGFKGCTDAVVVSFFNGLFEMYLTDTNMNFGLLPDKILVPTFVGSDLTGRMSELYTNTLRKFIIDHNLAVDESSGEATITIESRPQLNEMGVGGHGRIVAYKKSPDFVRMDIPYPIQHFITLPNIDKMSYTSAFVGQVSQVQLPYNNNAEELGVVSYWDFTK